jgi:hypothetical protein
MESMSDCSPQLPPMAQAPKPISEQWSSCLPKGRFFMVELFLSQRGVFTSEDSASVRMFHEQAAAVRVL